MIKTPFFRSIVSVIIVVALLHFIALQFYLYWTVWWFDVLLHFLGGFWISLVAVWFVYFSNLYKRADYSSLWDILYVGVIVTLFVAVGWEVFEWYAGIIVDSQDYWTDTIGDVIMGVIGAVAASFYAFLRSDSLTDRI